MAIKHRCIENRRRESKAMLSGWSRLALALVVVLTLVSSEALAEEAKTTDSGTEHSSLSELSAKLSDPTSDVWALFTEFDLTFNRGDLSDDDYKSGLIQSMAITRPVRTHQAPATARYSPFSSTTCRTPGRLASARR